MVNSSYVKNNGLETITVLLDGELYSATQDHPNFRLIMELVDEDIDDGLLELFDVGKSVSNYFEKVSELVTVTDGRVLYDGEHIDNELTDLIINVYEQGDLDGGQAFVKFFEKLKLNPNPHSVEHLYRWLADRDFSITTDGNFIAYKGIRSDFGSKTPGPGIVNGVPQNGHLDNSPGNVLEMARKDVEFNPSIGCSTGLHAGTWDYASSFANHNGVVVEVHINPRDVVSCPTDCEDSKLRVSRYTVIREVSGPYDSAFVKDVVESDNDESNSKLPDRDSRGRFIKKS